MHHLSNITLPRLIRGIILLILTLAGLHLLFNNLDVVLAGGALLIIAHLLVVSGVFYFVGGSLVRFIIRIHQPRPQSTPPQVKE